MTTAGTLMYQGKVSHEITCTPPLHYISEAVHTGIEVDGHGMVKMYTMLFPDTGWVESKTEAKQQIIDQLVKHVGAVQATIDRLRDEVLHETLATEAAA